MLDSGVRLAAASLPVGVPVVVGLVVALLRRRELPAVSTPAIAGLAVQLVVVLISTFLVAATSLDAFGLSPETLLPLSSVLGFVVILLQVVSWTLLLIALFRRLPAAAEPSQPQPQREDRTPTGRHALVDDRGDQVIAEAGTTFLPVGAGAGPRTGPRPVTGPPSGPPPGSPHAAPQGPPHGPPQGPPPGRPSGPPRGMPPGPSSPESSPLPPIPVPVPGVRAAEREDGVDPVDDEPADTETFAATDLRAPEAPEQDTPAQEEAEEELEETPEDAAEESAEEPVADDDRYPGYLQDAPESAADEDEADDTTTEYPGYLEGVAPEDAEEAPDTPDTPGAEDTPPGEDVDEEPVADADAEPADGTDTAAESDDAGADDDGATDQNGVAPPTTGNGAAGGHPWFDPDGEAARTQPERR
ncbi:hypothetical protein EV188_113122 [Actinomycetospora succinea]|uniref:Uncharacterized protein n=1 Tax=Actinomycetospora succinea TaxID=663603 RepID=A0A4V3D7C6_9PSEU|nr:hypothetical protein [Actinomycetospora succinea]TDQ47377.1 hypothetical protein EV188_113122 [Actinomycetospora succinea]